MIKIYKCNHLFLSGIVMKKMLHYQRRMLGKRQKLAVDGMGTRVQIVASSNSTSHNDAESTFI